MPLLSDYITQIRVLVHDLGSVDWTDAELTTITNNARQRVALDAHNVRTFYTGLTAITNQETYPISGGVGGVAITNAGSGYLSAPTVTFGAAPAGGVTATGTATLDTLGNGTVTQVLMSNWGSGYTAAPSVTFSASPGVTALGNATALLNVLDIVSISVLWPGNINRYTLKWAPFTFYQAWCRAWSGQFSTPEAWTTYDEGNLLYLYPIPSQGYTLEIDAINLPTALVNLTDNDTQVLQPHADAVQYYGAFLARVKLQDYDKAEYMRRLYKERLLEVKMTRQDRRLPSVYRQSFRRMARW